jgi:hypothetical protein
MPVRAVSVGAVKLVQAESVRALSKDWSRRLERGQFELLNSGQ